jgi:hypothetical protein
VRASEIFSILSPPLTFTCILFSRDKQRMLLTIFSLRHTSLKSISRVQIVSTLVNMPSVSLIVSISRVSTTRHTSRLIDIITLTMPLSLLPLLIIFKSQSLQLVRSGILSLAGVRSHMPPSLLCLSPPLSPPSLPSFPIRSRCCSKMTSCLPVQDLRHPIEMRGSMPSPKLSI